MASRILALIIWAAVAASVAFWGLRWLAHPAAVPPNASAVSLDNAGKGDPHRLLVGPSKASDAGTDMGQNAMLAGRIKLIGVVAPKNPEDKEGVALVSVDGKPPRALHIGDVVDGDNVIRKLTQRNAEIGPASGPTAVSLDLPGLPPPSTGVLPAVEGLTTNPPSGGVSDQTPPPMPAGLPVINDHRHHPRDLPRGPITN